MARTRSSGSPPSTSSLPAQEVTPITEAALASILATSVEEHLVPGAFVVVTTPEGTVSAGYGTTRRCSAWSPSSWTVNRYPTSCTTDSSNRSA
jgi:D-alanyl-D-alanine carboxypeptidase